MVVKIVKKKNSTILGTVHLQYQKPKWCYVRVRGEDLLAWMSLMSKKIDKPNEIHVKDTKAVARLYASHLVSGLE